MSTTTGTTSTTTPPIFDDVTETKEEEGVTEGVSNMEIDSQSESQPLITTPVVAEPESVTEFELGGGVPSDADQTEITVIETEMVDNADTESATATITSHESAVDTEPVMS